MESLWNLYEERLNQLNDTFLHLLSEFEENNLLTTPQLSKYRIQYLGEVIQKTVKNDQEKLIKRLYQEIDHLKTHNKNLQELLKSEIDLENLAYQESDSKDYEIGCQYKEKSHSVGSTKVSLENTDSRKHVQKQSKNRNQDHNDSLLSPCNPRFINSTKFIKSKMTSPKSSIRNSVQYSREDKNTKQVRPKDISNSNRSKHSDYGRKCTYNQQAQEQTHFEGQLQDEIKGFNFKYLKF